MKQPWKTNSSLIVDLSAIRHNLEVVKSQLSDETKVMPVIKADAYGHGSIEVANALQDQADWFAVNAVEEGIELRNAGIELPILVFGVPDTETAKLYASYSLTATISHLVHFKLFSAGTEYHLNLDTGMGRLGFRSAEIEKVIAEMGTHSELMCTGIYSHFATSDRPDSPKVKRQLSLFKEIRKLFSDGLLTHISNTGGTFFYPDAAFDIVRPGISIYGYSPGETPIDGLRPALMWESYLAQVKPIQKGETVSYGANWQAPADGYIGIIPVGYEDGLKRILSGKINFHIEGKAYPQVGNITMNYCMVYLGSEDRVVGTEVQLLESENGEAGVENWAAQASTIPYEILTSLSPKIPRVYKNRT